MGGRAQAELIDISCCTADIADGRIAPPVFGAKPFSMLHSLFTSIGTDAVGYAAAFCTTSAFLPQAYVAIKHRDTKSLSLAMYIIFTTGVALWLVYGVIKHDWALIAANAITVTLAALILITKLRYDVFAKSDN